MKKHLQKLMFWRRHDLSEWSEPVRRQRAPVPEQRPNDPYRDSQGNPTPEALDEERAGKARGELVDEHVRKRNEEDDSPRPDYEP